MYKLPFREEQRELENEGRGLRFSWTTVYYTPGLKKESRVRQIKRVKGLTGSYTFFSLPCLFNIFSPEGNRSPLTSPTGPAFSRRRCQICCWPPCPQLSGRDWLRTSNGPQRCCVSLVCSNLPRVQRRDEAPFSSQSLDQPGSSHILFLPFFPSQFHREVFWHSEPTSAYCHLVQLTKWLYWSMCLMTDSCIPCEKDTLCMRCKQEEGQGTCERQSTKLITAVNHLHAFA